MNSVTANQIAAPRPKRRWFQFSLRGLFVLVFLLCLALAWLADKLDGKRRERAAVAWLGLGHSNRMIPDAVEMIHYGREGSRVYDYQ